jgi:hypothetical protein
MRRLSPAGTVFAVALPLVGLALLAMVLSNEAKWAQALAALAIITLIVLVAKGRLAADRKLVNAGKLPGWFVGPGRYVFIIAGVMVIAFILGKS